jgi:hypothetical protein
VTAEAVEHLQALRERAAYLGARIDAKRSVGWESQYDERERDALVWALRRIEAAVIDDKIG